MISDFNKRKNNLLRLRPERMKWKTDKTNFEEKETKIELKPNPKMITMKLWRKSCTKAFWEENKNG